MRHTKVESQIYEDIAPLLNDANYERLSLEQLLETMNKTSPYGVEVSVEFEDFDKIELYVRGESIQTDEIRDPKKLYLAKKKIELPLYRRLFLIIKPKNLEKRAQEIASQSGKDIAKVRASLHKDNPLLISDVDNKNIYIKLFKDIPHADLEMLFPNTSVRMTLFDKLKLGVIGGSGTVGGASTMMSKLGAAAMDPMAAVGAIGAIGAIGAFAGILWRQIKEVFFKRTRYMAKLSQQLYFHNLDNNEGALNYMINMAVQEESKEALLVYLFLAHQPKPLSINELDCAIEEYIEIHYQTKIDFEVLDGVNGVRDLGLLVEKDEKLSVLGIDKALEVTLYR